MPKLWKASNNASIYLESLFEDETKMSKLPTGVIDIETDPFLHGRIPIPFASAFKLNDRIEKFWGKQCIKKMVERLHKLEPCKLYAHNGGKFDFHYLLPYAEKGRVKIIRNRIAEMAIGNVRLIDSFLLLPFPLAAYKKTEIDYTKFEKERRNDFKQEILDYLTDDCIDLDELLSGFKAIVGDHMTIGGAAFALLKKMNYTLRASKDKGPTHDARFRPYYIGGRVQAFEIGTFNDNYSIYDINSAYPYAMTFRHPIGIKYKTTRRLPENEHCYFASIIARSKGSLPLRNDNELIYPTDQIATRYNATGWEIEAGLDTNTLEIIKVEQVKIPVETQDFNEYVQFCFTERKAAKEKGDKIGDLAYKYLVNSGYGKLASNPEEYRDYLLSAFGDNVKGYEFECDLGNVSLWSRPASQRGNYYDVATASSITGFVRSMLWRAICRSDRVIYCDTDSIICRSSDVPNGQKLGQWKLEGTAEIVHIAGKKLYAAKGHFGDKTEKIASKGARLNFNQIESIVKGATVKWKQAAPTFSAKRTFIDPATMTDDEIDKYFIAREIS